MLSAEADRKLNKTENIEPVRKEIVQYLKCFAFNQVCPFRFLFKLLPFPKRLPGDNCGTFHKWSGDDRRKAAELSISWPEHRVIVMPWHQRHRSPLCCHLTAGKGRSGRMRRAHSGRGWALIAPESSFCFLLGSSTIQMWTQETLIMYWN